MRFLFFSLSLSRLNFIAQLQLQDGKVDNDNARGEKKEEKKKERVRMIEIVKNNIKTSMVRKSSNDRQ